MPSSSLLALWVSTEILQVLFFSADVSFRSPWCSNKVSIIHRIGRNVNNLFHEKVIVLTIFLYFISVLTARKYESTAKESRDERRKKVGEEKPRRTCTPRHISALMLTEEVGKIST